MARRWIGDKPLSKPMIILFSRENGSLDQEEITHCGRVTPYGVMDRGQLLFRVLLPDGTNPLHGPALTYFCADLRHLGSNEVTSVKFESQQNAFLNVAYKMAAILLRNPYVSCLGFH